MPKTIRWFVFVFLVGVAATVGLAQLQSARNADRVAASLKQSAERITQQVMARMQIYQFGLRGARGTLVIAGENGISLAAFQAYSATRDIDTEFPGAAGFGFIRRVAPEHEDSFLRNARQDGAPDFTIRQFKPHDRERFVVQYFWPIEPNRAAIGLDIGSEDTRRRAATEAIRTGVVTLTGPIELLQASGRKLRSFLILLPVYRPGMPLNTEQQRDSAAYGWTFAPLRSDAILESIDFATQGVGLSIYDASDPARPVLFFRSDGSQIGTVSPMEAGSAAVINRQDRDVYRRQWRFEFSPTPALIAQLNLTAPIQVLVFGLAASILLAALASALANARLRKQQFAAERAHLATMMQDAERNAELARINAVQAAILDNIPCGLSVFDGELKLVAHNSEFRTLLDIESLFDDGVPSFADVITLNARRGEYGPGNVDEIVAGIVERAKTPVQHQFERQRPHGKPIEIRGAPLPGGGFVTTYTDISQRKNAEAAMRDAMAQAEQASRAKGEFLANMSHEIRTPLNAVLGIAHLISRTPLSYEQRNLLDMIRSSGKSLLGILNDILDFSKIEAGKMELCVASFALQDLLKALATIMSVNAGARDIALIIDVAPDVPAHLLGDEMRLQQILVNLTGNAIKFTEHGEVVLSVTRESGQGSDVRLQFSVRDSGIGMTPEQRQRLFSAFTQADSTTTRKFGGTGLGLIISLRLAEMMGGTIDVQSTFGQGTTFSVSLPLALPAMEDDPNPLPEPAPMAGLRLLVVDHHATSRAALTGMIASCLWQADCVASGQEGVERLRQAKAAGTNYDAVLLDWQMPGADVAEHIAACRTAWEGEKLALIVMVSAHGRDKLMHLEQPLGADAFLAKPVTAGCLRDTLTEALRQSRAGGDDAMAPGGPDAGAVLHGRILLVEDNLINQTVALGILQQAGASVEIANHGQEAVDMLRRNPERYQLVLMDIQMPVMDGFAATKLIRNELGMALPILAMTAGVMESERISCFDCGMNDVIAKPIDIEKMLATLRRFLPGAAPEAESPPAAMDASSPEHFNVAPLAQAMGGNPAAMARLQGLIAGIVSNGMQSIEQAQQALAAGRVDEATRIFHTMRGSLGTLGAKQVAAIAQQMETAIKDNDADRIAVLFEEVEQALALTISAAQRWLAQQDRGQLAGRSGEVS